MQKTITIPARDELLSRLTAIDDNPHQVEKFYPHLLKVAGRELIGPGIANVLVLAMTDYTRDFPLPVFVAMRMSLWKFVPAFTDDKDVRADALAHFRACDLPTH